MKMVNSTTIFFLKHEPARVTKSLLRLEIPCSIPRVRGINIHSF